MKKNATVIMYIISISLISFAIGMFTLVFNLHISMLVDSKIFLSNFLLVGNIAMAVGGGGFGRLLDLCNKKTILLFAVFLSAILFTLECFSSNIIFLYIISLGYGLSFSVLMSIHTPFVMENIDEKNQIHILNLCSSCKLFASTMGVFIGGNLPLRVIFKINDSPYQLILIVASCVYLLAVIPVFFINVKQEHNNMDQIKYKLIDNKKEDRKYPNMRIFSSIFFILGLLLFFSPYMNLYLNNRYPLDLNKISIIITIIEICPIITNVFLSKLFDCFEEKYIIICSCVLCIFFYGVLTICGLVYLQIGCFLIIYIISSFLFPQINRYILKEYPKEKRGQMSGKANMFYNIGDSIGTYSEGIFINYGIFRIPFFISCLLFYALLLFMLKLKK